MSEARYLGLTWDHPRGYNALAAAAREIAPPGLLHWDIAICTPVLIYPVISNFYDSHLGESERVILVELRHLLYFLFMERNPEVAKDTGQDVPIG